MRYHVSAFEFIVILLTWSLVNGFLLPSSDSNSSLSPHKRAVTYGDTGNKNAASSVCNSDQRKVLEQSMSEAVELAKAGSNGLAIILDMLTKEKTEYNKLSRADKDRIRETYFTFFGRVKKEAQFDDARSNATFIKTILDRITGLTVSTWPEAVNFFCDSTYYLDKDKTGRTWDQVDPPLPPITRTDLEWKYDVHLGIWSRVKKKANCALDGSEVAAFTVAFDDTQTDRLTFCPAWFTVIAAPEAGKSFTDLDPTKDISVGTMLKDFTRKAGRIFLHEHLHTWTFNQLDMDHKLTDLKGKDSYGPDNAQRLAMAADTKKVVYRNIENVVYWSIAMFYPTWDWRLLTAAVPGTLPLPSSTQVVK